MEKRGGMPPTNATWPTLPTKERCWNCQYYSFKTYGGEDSSSGKCFRDHASDHVVYYVDGNQVCPSFKMDAIDQKE